MAAELDLSPEDEDGLSAAHTSMGTPPTTRRGLRSITWPGGSGCERVGLVSHAPARSVHSQLADLILVFTHQFSESLVNESVADFQFIDPQSHTVNQRPKLFAPAKRVDLLRCSPQ